MKKLLFILFVILFGVGSLYPAQITVMSPNGGENWQIGSTHNITWNSSGITGNIGIKLFKNGKSLGYIVQSIPASTKIFRWTISKIIGIGSISAGSGYQIQIKKSGVAGDLSNGKFTISSLKKSASITVTAPKAADTLYAGKSFNIRWEKTGSMDSNVIIEIYKNSIMQSNIVLKLTSTNSGSRFWNIPATFKPGKYQIRVKTSDNKYSGDSNIFNIQKSNKSDIEIIPGFNKPATFNKPKYTLAKKYHPNVFINEYPDLKILNIKINSNKLVAKRAFSTLITLINIGGDMVQNKKFYLNVFEKNSSFSSSTPILHRLRKNERISVRINNIVFKKAGIYTLKFMVDSSRTIKESNEMNNYFRKTITIIRNTTPNVFGKLYFKDCKDSSKWVNCGDSTDVFYKYSNARSVKIYDKDTSKIYYSWKSKDGKIHSGTGSVLVPVYTGITSIEMEVVGLNESFYSNCWIKSKAYIKEFSAVNNVKIDPRIKSGKKILLVKGKVIFNLDIRGADFAYIKVLDSSTNRWEILKYKGKAMRLYAIKNYNSDCLKIIKRKIIGHPSSTNRILRHYMLVAKTKNRVLTSHVYDIPNIESIDIQ